MKVHDLLLEYKHDITLKQLYPQLEIAANKANRTPTELLRTIESLDPTDGINNQYTLWILRRFLNGDFEFSSNSFNNVATVLAVYHQLKNKNIPNLPKDIGQIKTFQQLENIIQTNRVDTDIDLDKLNHVDILYRGPWGALLSPRNFNAACQIGSPKWCTSIKKDQFDSYKVGSMNDYEVELSEEDRDFLTDLYIWIDAKLGGKYQFHFITAEFKDENNQNIPTNRLKYFAYQHPVLKEYFDRFFSILSTHSEFIDLLAHWAALIKQRLPEHLEKTILNSESSSTGLFYAINVIKGRWPKYENYILKSKDAAKAVSYARMILKGRWPEAEPIISSQALSAYEYANMVLEEPWPENSPYKKIAEESILSDFNFALKYANRVLGHRWPDLEKKLLGQGYRPIYTIGDMIALYVATVIKGRWPEWEKILDGNLWKVEPFILWKHENAYAEEIKRLEKSSPTVENVNKSLNITDYDKILARLCEMILKGQHKNPKKYGLVAAAVLDGDKIASSTSSYMLGKWRHAERNALDKFRKKHGPISSNAVILTTLSPCSEAMVSRYGSNCTKLINGSKIKKVYTGFMDPIQFENQKEFEIKQTNNEKIKAICKQFFKIIFDAKIEDNKGGKKK